MKARITFAVAGATLALGACVSKTTGNEGNYVFSYAADDDIGNFNKPIAVGAKLDLEVRTVGTNRAVDLTSASFVDPSILDVVDFSDHMITIEALSEGNGLLEVEGVAEGETKTDSVNLLARVPEVVHLRHTCTASSDAVYLADQRVFVAFDMEMANGQPVIGYGYYPATASNTSAFTFVESASGQQFMAFDTGSASASLALESDLDSTSINVDVATPAEIDGVEEPIAYVLEDIDVGDINSFYVRPLVGEQTVCQGNITKNVASVTPAICAVTDREPESESGELAYEFGWFQIEGLQAGECQYTVTFPDGNGGAGASAQFSYPIEP